MTPPSAPHTPAARRSLTMFDLVLVGLVIAVAAAIAIGALAH